VPEEFTISEALHNPFFRMFLIGVSEVCDEAGVNLTLLARTGETVRDAIVDGFILTRAEYLGAIDPRRLRNVPFVLMDVDAENDARVVRVDAYGACRSAAEHLLALGHRRFGIVSFLRDRSTPAILHRPGRNRPES